MRSERQIHASRANGAKSRGPVTPAGKLASSQNALTHGLLAGTVVLKGESEVRFLKLLADLCEELQPQTIVENSLVENMAAARWRQLRIMGMEKAGMDYSMLQRAGFSENEDQATCAALTFRALGDESRCLELINRYEARYDRQYLRAHRRFLELCDRRTPPPSSSNPPSPPPPPAPPTPNLPNEPGKPLKTTIPQALSHAAAQSYMLLREVTVKQRQSFKIPGLFKVLNAFGSLASIVAVAALALPLISLPAAGQFPADSTVPRDKRTKRRIGKFEPGPVPRTADGKVDLSGMWGYAGYTSDIAKDYDVGTVPMTPLAEKLFKERQANEGIYDPEARCLPTGVPRRDPYPSRIMQTPNLIVILFEGSMHSYRQIFLDRATHPQDLGPSWYGDSIGKWDGDTLVVDTVGFNGKTWLDLAGHPTSDKLHVVERYTRPQLGELKLDIAIEDPVMYTKAWNVTELMPLMPGQNLLEYVCAENEKDVPHLVPGGK